MFNKHILQFRPLLMLFVVLIGWMAIPVFVKSLLKTSFYEFQAPVAVSASYLRTIQDFWAHRIKSNDELYEAGQDLARLNASYENAIVENISLKEELRRLENLLQLPSRPEYRYEIARVIERDFNSWWQQISIRKGRNHGIAEGDPVIFTGGVVGRVRQVGRTTSTVDLISNNHVRLAVVIEGDNRPMSFKGDGARAFGEPRGLTEFVPTDVTIPDLQHPPRLVTSGMGGVFPPGLHIGYLINLKHGAGGMFLDGTVVLDGRLMGVTEVAVLVNIDRISE